MVEQKLIATLTIEGEPISPVNHYKARAVRFGGRYRAMMYMDDKYRKYKEEIEKLAKAYVSEHNLNPTDAAIMVEADFYFGTKRRKDLSNAGKLEFDALNGYLWKDDSQILKLITEKRYDKDNPRTELRIYEYPSEHWPN